MATEQGSDTSAWSFDAEIIAFVEMAKAQIAVALREAEAPGAELGATIADVAAVGRRLDALAAELRGIAPEAARAIGREVAYLTGSARGSSVAMQFHDRLVQRLTHAHDALQVLAGAIADRHLHAGPAEWERLRQEIRAQYSMEQERVIFDLLVGGANPDHVIDALKKLRESGSPGHVDLF